MKLSEKIKMLQQHYGWDQQTALIKCINAILPEFSGAELGYGGVPVRHTTLGADVLLGRMRKESVRSFDDAMNLVIDFVREHGFDDEIVVADIERRGPKVDIALLKPYGLFIVHEDKRVEDNYCVFEERPAEPQISSVGKTLVSLAILGRMFQEMNR